MNVPAYVDKALDLLQQRSIESAAADWPALRAQAHSETAGAQTPADTHAAIEAVITALGNPHTRLVTAQRMAAVRAARAPRVPSGRMIGPVAHVLLPGTPSSNRRAYVTAGLQAMRALIAHYPTGWVVDLRDNLGGDMYPMLTVVAPLLGEGDAGAFIEPDGTTTRWGVRSRHVHVGGRRTFRFRRVPRAVHRPVALLVDGKTASSGEAVLVSFTGLDRARSFGEPTAGFATANQTFRLPDGAWLVITTALMADRTGRVYGNAPVAPDSPVSGTSGTHDRALDASIGWLSGLPA
ncbi:hypothetical protein BBK82_09715 [Lentzea guizhouensis]|uniref:Tail specific protease domain-containing protein n=1 Tax=Lentzea guizhouensis TaxID=1586287 RepID=A0A1B2HF01_9PSEU|nr:S41 family peptidase [Lentzea guizhouensis]ANZ36299.1 hypothetical protein BBK82_09715 [Lentzea guizhouensis]